jgi:hypothetical protein
LTGGAAQEERKGGRGRKFRHQRERLPPELDGERWLWSSVIRDEDEVGGAGDHGRERRPSAAAAVPGGKRGRARGSYFLLFRESPDQ